MRLYAFPPCAGLFAVTSGLLVAGICVAPSPAPSRARAPLASVGADAGGLTLASAHAPAAPRATSRGRVISAADAITARPPRQWR
ncbi:MAG TPA: hypothetical protein VIV12_20265, partial [Streptosporangiaceae bacterium]